MILWMKCGLSEIKEHVFYKLLIKNVSFSTKDNTGNSTHDHVTLGYPGC